MSDTTRTAPIPEQRGDRLPPPNPAPNRPTECERCGAPAISTRGVGRHDLWHRNQDLDARRQKALLDSLQAFLDSVENLIDEEGHQQKFADWKHEVDEILDSLPTPEELDRLRALNSDAAIAVEPLPWPGNPFPEPEDEEQEPDSSPSSTVPAAAAAAAEDHGSRPAERDGFDGDDRDYVTIPH